MIASAHNVQEKEFKDHSEEKWLKEELSDKFGTKLQGSKRGARAKDGASSDGKGKGIDEVFEELQQSKDASGGGSAFIDTEIWA